MRTPSSQKCRLDLAPPLADRFIWRIVPLDYGPVLLRSPLDSTSRWTPCPPEYSKRWLQVGLGCVQLSPSCPFRRPHTFRFLRPARLRTPLLGYGAPHLSARGTSTLLNNPAAQRTLPVCRRYDHNRASSSQQAQIERLNGIDGMRVHPK
jgi:hypothetical protein